MTELDLIIFKLINKKGSNAEENIIKILCMNTKEKLKLLNYLYDLYTNYNIIPSDDRLANEISNIIKEKK